MSTKAISMALAMMLMAVGAAAAHQSTERDIQAPRGERPEDVQAPRGELPEEVQAPRGTRTGD